MNPKIVSVRALEILDSRGNPTLKVFVALDDGTVSSASVPSGASTGENEACELRAGDPKRYGGKGVLRAVANVTEAIAPELIGMDPVRQAAIDHMMIELDGTPNKSRRGDPVVSQGRVGIRHLPSFRRNRRHFHGRLRRCHASIAVSESEHAKL